MLVRTVISDPAVDRVGGARRFLRCQVTAFLRVSDFQSDSLKPFRYPFLHHTVTLLVSTDDFSLKITNGQSTVNKTKQNPASPPSPICISE